MSILVKIVDSRLEYSNETFSFRKQYNYTNLFVHSCERCLSEGQGRNEGGQGGRNSPGAESLWGRRITAGGAEKS